MKRLAILESRNYNALCITLFLSFPFSLLFPVGFEKAAVVRAELGERTRVGWKRAEIVMQVREFDLRRIFTAMELLSGCLDILRDTLRRIRAPRVLYTRSLSGYTRDYSRCLVRGLHWSLLLHTGTYVWRIISSAPRKRKNSLEIFIHNLIYPHSPSLLLPFFGSVDIIDNFGAFLYESYFCFQRMIPLAMANYPKDIPNHPLIIFFNFLLVEKNQLK